MQLYGMSEEDTVQAIGYYREYFQKSGMLDNEIYSGIPALLSELQSQGKKLVEAARVCGADLGAFSDCSLL